MTADTRISRTRRVAMLAPLLIAVFASGCATPTVAEPPPAPVATAATAPPVTQVYVYPTAGQSDAQLDRDRYECHVWAVKQSGYDPGEPRLAPHQRVAVVAGPPPGATVAGSTVAGAVLGAAVSNPHDTGEGAVVGAIAGAIVGSAVEASRQEQVTREVSASRNRANAYLERQSDNYRRAIGACLEGRGYTVK